MVNLLAKAIDRQAWMDKASCQHFPADWWFPNITTRQGMDQQRDAIRICQSCPVMDTCRRYAQTTKTKHGIWGGIHYGSPDI